jgi:hypothetical protein
MTELEANRSGLIAGGGRGRVREHDMMQINKWTKLDGISLSSAIAVVFFWFGEKKNTIS